MIRNEERLVTVYDNLVANGQMKRHYMHRHLRDLSRSATHARAPAQGELDALGIKVTRG